jgi:hypothetical protein
MTDRLLDRYVTGGSAWIEGEYRYRLDRWWGPGPRMCFIMLNPSTADADQNDPTIRRCIAFAKRDGFDGITVVNLFARRCTRPEDLEDPGDPTGPANLHVIRTAVESASVAVAAWGAHPIAVPQAAALRVLLVWQMFCLGKTKSGAPRHPLYVKGDAELVRWP